MEKREFDDMCQNGNSTCADNLTTHVASSVPRVYQCIAVLDILVYVCSNAWCFLSLEVADSSKHCIGWC